MSAEEQTAASTEAAPAVEPSTNGEQSNGAAEPTTTNGDAEAMEVDGGAAPPAADEKKEEETTDGVAETKADETPAAEPEKTEETESEPAKKESSSKPASGRQTRPKPESAAKPASTTEKKAARPKSTSSGGPAKTKASGAAASAAAADRTYSFGDIVLGRLKGYPPWPARVTNPDDLPQKVIVQRPSKNPSIYCVQYFPAGDYSWLNTREITPLSPSDINDWLNAGHRATGLLRKAYETAKDPSEWDESQAAKLQAVADAEEEDEEMDVDELEDEEGEETGGKRKKAGANKKGPAKKAKTEKKSKPESEAPKSKPKAAAKKAEKPESKPAAAAEPAGDEDPAASDPICVKVKGWRHSLQRAFLGKDLPSAEEMPAHDETFKKIEAYNDMTIQALQYSKIGKVMKKISTLEGIPRDDELHIRERAAKLMNDWHAFIEKEQGTEGQANGDKE